MGERFDDILIMSPYELPMEYQIAPSLLMGNSKRLNIPKLSKKNNLLFNSTQTLFSRSIKQAIMPFRCFTNKIEQKLKCRKAILRIFNADSIKFNYFFGNRTEENIIFLVKYRILLLLQ